MRRINFILCFLNENFEINISNTLQIEYIAVGADGRVGGESGLQIFILLCTVKSF